MSGLLLLLLLLLFLLLPRMWRAPPRGIADGDGEEVVTQAVEDEGGTEEG
jgi:hypothetical protein